MRSLVAGLVLLSASVCAQPVAQIPTPESHFGHRIGVDRELLDWDKVVSYYQALAKTSDKIRVEELGKTAEGRPFIAATISSAATLRNLDHYRDIQAKLADPRRTTPAEAARLIGEGKTVVVITCSIHATEVASTHSAIQFVYNLLTQDTPKFRAILDNVIILLVPSQNPDGLDIVTRWYRKTLGTAYEGTVAAGALSEICRARQQSRLVHFLAARAAPHGCAAKQLASADRLRRAPAGLVMRRVCSFRPG